MDDFLVERWLNTYEFNVKINLAETCVDPFTVKELLNLAGRIDFIKEIQNAKLTYGHIEGSPKLREGLAALYRCVDPEEVLVTGGAIEANFNSYYSLIEPGDEVVCVHPTYQQLYSVAKGFGAKVKLLKLKPGNNWLPSIEDLKTLVDRKTKMIIINNPNNPTGSLIDGKLLKAICEVAQDFNAFLHSDEAYRGLYLIPGETVPSALDLYEKAISVGSFSKPFGLTGLRMGWIASNCDVINECKRHRDYTTISKGIIDEAIATIAVEILPKILERNNNLIRGNHRLLEKWINSEPAASWVSPRAGSVGFIKLDIEPSSKDFCKRLISEKSTLLVPGECFEVDKHVRIGFGNNSTILNTGLSLVGELLREHL